MEVSTSKSCVRHIHVVAQSLMMGYIDDVYLKAIPISSTDKKHIVRVEMLSQLRFGKGDMNKNHDHIEQVYTCL